MIRTERPVQSIDVSANGVTVRTVGGESIDADYAIATLAPSLLAGLGGNFLDSATRDTLNEVNMQHACKVGFQGKSRFWEAEDRIYGGISWTRDVITQIWYPNYSFNSPTGVLTGAYNSGAKADEFGALSRDARVEAALAGGEKLHPGYRDKVFAENGVTIAWAKMAYQTGGWANDTAFTQPPVFEALAGESPIGDRVFMAGDWFSYWPGWQVGSLDSAHLATDQIAAMW